MFFIFVYKYYTYFQEEGKSEAAVNETLIALIVEDILINTFSDVSPQESEKLAKVLEAVSTNDQLASEDTSSASAVSPQLQFLEPDLGPAVLPLQV